MTVKSVNDAGEVVGTWLQASGNDYGQAHAFIYDDVNGMRDLNALLPVNSEWTLSRAMHISNARQVVGEGERFGEHRMFRFDLATGVITDVGVLPGQADPLPVSVRQGREQPGPCRRRLIRPMALLGPARLHLHRPGSRPDRPEHDDRPLARLPPRRRRHQQQRRGGGPSLQRRPERVRDVPDATGRRFPGCLSGPVSRETVCSVRRLRLHAAQHSKPSDRRCGYPGWREFPGSRGQCGRPGSRSVPHQRKRDACVPLDQRELDHRHWFGRGVSCE